ncbi:hypothetical protein NE237_024019 [Protea cynaroides]|uniref:Uncharacterized protein n=1 Tax=Protea cynaroides TaxID=273540 RepID=A0A9Q0HE30_9MAGN|nr:hypothetical protein NE237_024019 [Protea cynaroides]
MAFSANILYQNKTLIPLDFQVLKLRNPKLFINSPSLSPQLQSKKRILASASTTNVASDFQVQKNNPASIKNWEDFARNVSGEWDGHGADFTSEGKPIELPESVVPEAFREWEVQVFDWQTQCPTLANSEERILAYKLIKLLPTVGCEADAATRYTIDERNIGGTDNQVSGFAYHPSGCYVALWPLEDHGSYRLLELEYCLVDPRNRESRVRIIQVVRADNTVSSLQNIRVFCEQWYGPFRNGEQLGGCSLRDSAFASTEALKISEVVGEWEGPVAVTRFLGAQTDIFQELVADKPQKSVRDQQGLILLPKQLWCSLKKGDSGEICGEVGWLLDHGLSITSKCFVSKDGKLKEIAIANETAVSEKK